MRHALLYVPGSSQHLVDQRATLIADRIARAVQDRLAATAPFRFRVTATSEAHKLESGIALDRARIEAAEGDGWRPFLDVIEVRYLDRFSEPLTALPALARAVPALAIVAADLPKALRAIGRSGTPKGTLDKMQASFLGLVILVTLVSFVYWVLVGAMALLGLSNLLGTDAAKTDTWLAALVVVVAGLTAGKVTFKRLVETVEKSAIELFSIVAYIRNQPQFAAAPNVVSDALALVQRQGYERIDLMSFSLGCLLAGDAIWPRRPRLKAEPLKVHTWISIGYPYDLIASTHPEYFQRREPPAIALDRWINVVAADDFLGSNFRCDDAELEPDGNLGFAGGADAGGGRPPALRKPDRNLYFTSDRGRIAPSWLDGIVPLRRVINHTLYWDQNDAAARTCFGLVVAEAAGWLEQANTPAASAPGSGATAG